VSGLTHDHARLEKIFKEYLRVFHSRRCGNQKLSFRQFSQVCPDLQPQQTPPNTITPEQVIRYHQKSAGTVRGAGTVPSFTLRVIIYNDLKTRNFTEPSFPNHPLPLQPDRWQDHRSNLPHFVRNPANIFVHCKDIPGKHCTADRGLELSVFHPERIGELN
jgi:hypothetical protein